MALETIQIDLIIETAQSAKTLGEVRDATREVKKALDQVEIGSDSFKKLNAQLEEGSEKVTKFRKGVDGLKAFEAFGKTITSSFGLASSAIGLFAEDNDKLQKSLLKVQSALVLVSSFSQLAEAVKAAKLANDALNLSLLSNPYVLIAVGIAAAAVAIYSFASGEETAEEKTKKQNEALDKQTKAFDDVIDAIERKAAVEKSATRDAVKQAEIDKKTNEEKLDQLNKEIKLIEEKGEKSISFGGSITNQEKISIDLSKLSQKERERYNKLVDESKKASDALKISTNNLGFVEEDVAKKASEAAKEAAKQKRIQAANEVKIELDLLKEKFKNAQKSDEDRKAREKKESDEFDKQTDRSLNAIIKRTELEIRTKKQANIDTTQDEITLEKQRATFLLENTKLTEEEKANIIKESQLNIEKIIIDSNKKISDKQLEIIKNTTAAIGNITKAGEGINSLGQDITNLFSNTLSKIPDLVKKIGDDTVDVKDKIVAALQVAAEILGEINTVVEENAQRRIEAIQAERDTTIQNAELERDEQLRILDEQLASGTAKKEQDAQARAEIDEKLRRKTRDANADAAKREREERLKAFKAEKAIRITQAIIATAAAVIAAFASGGNPIIGAIFAAIAAAVGAVQIGIIAAQQPPAFAKGGLFEGKGGPTQDANQIKISDGEFIMNANSTNAFLPMLELMNQAGNGSVNNSQPNLISTSAQNFVPKQLEPNKAQTVKVVISQNDIRDAGITDDLIRARTTF